MPGPALDTFHRRLAYAIAAFALIALGLASRRYATHLPQFLAAYAGDTIWAMMAYCGLSMLVPTRSLPRRVGLALLFCYAIEISQLYHRPWIDHIRSNTLGALVLGRGFLWSDLVCYTVGVGLATGLERILARRVGLTA